MSYQLGNSFGLNEQEQECQYPDPYTGQCLDSLIPQNGIPQSTADCQIVDPWSGQCLDDVVDPAYLPPIPGQDQPQMPVPADASCQVVDPYTGYCLDEYMKQVPGTDPVDPYLPPSGVECEWGTPCSDCGLEGTTAPFCAPAGQLPPVPSQPGVCPEGMIGAPPYCYPQPAVDPTVDPAVDPTVDPQVTKVAKVCPAGSIGPYPNCYSTTSVAVVGIAGLGILGYAIYKLSQKSGK